MSQPDRDEEKYEYHPAYQMREEDWVEGNAVWRDIGFGPQWRPAQHFKDLKNSKNLFRRLKPAPAQGDGWTEFAKQPPEFNEFPVWVWMPQNTYPQIKQREHGVGHISWTHWKRAEIPAPPKVLSQKEKDEAEAIEFAMFFNKGELRNACVAGFLAGLRSGRVSK